MKGAEVIEQKDGDLFSAPSQMALGHLISADDTMGGSVDRQFRQYYGRSSEIESVRPTVGSVVVRKEHGRFIYSLVTRDRFYDSTNLANLNKCLIEMREHMIRNHVIDLGLPRIGCGRREGLLWVEVHAILDTVFRYYPIKITVFTRK